MKWSSKIFIIMGVAVGDVLLGRFLGVHGLIIDMAAGVIIGYALAQ